MLTLVYLSLTLPMFDALENTTERLKLQAKFTICKQKYFIVEVAFAQFPLLDLSDIPTQFLLANLHQRLDLYIATTCCDSTSNIPNFSFRGR